MAFDYDEAFSRNIGWVTESEQLQLRQKKIAIAGLGGVGGVHLLTLARLGLEHFHLAEFDRYEVPNFNRQVGAYISTTDQSKLHVMDRMAKDINPQIQTMLIEEGVTEKNVDAFLEGVDLYVDGIDFFALDARRLIFARCAELGIPAITAGPVGMGTAYLIYMPGGMTFEEYFGFDADDDIKNYLKFMLGLTPTVLHRKYLVDKLRLNLAERKGPSTIMACNLCAGVAGVEALKILLHRQGVYAMPYYHLFDAYHNKYVRGKMWFGSRNPLYHLKTWLGYKPLKKRMENG